MVTIIKGMVRRCIIASRLTAHMSAGIELGFHHRIYVDHHVPLVRHLVVALLDLVIDPVLEGLPGDGRDHVHHPLLRSMLHVRDIGQIVGNLRVLFGPLQDLLDGQVLVLWNVQGLDIVNMNPLLLSAYDRFEEVDRDILYRSKDSNGIKVVDIPYGGRYTSHSYAKKV